MTGNSVGKIAVAAGWIVAYAQGVGITKLSGLAASLTVASAALRRAETTKLKHQAEIAGYCARPQMACCSLIVGENCAL